MPARALVLAALFASALVAPAAAQTSVLEPRWVEQTARTPELRFEALVREEEGGMHTLLALRVLDAPTGRLVQTETGLDAMPFAIEPTRFVALDDANFDGAMDFSIPANDGGAGPNSSRSFYLYDAGQGRFVFDPTLSELTQVAIDPRRRVVASASRDGCCRHVHEERRYVEGELVVVSRVEEALSADGTELVRTEGRRTAAGRWVTRITREPVDAAGEPSRGATRGPHSRP